MKKQTLVKSEVAVKMAYSLPSLRVYGSVSKLTLGSGGTKADGNNTLTKAAQSQGSDRSIKENIVRIKDHPMGFGLYLFDYKSEFRDAWGFDRQFGVMADEVEVVMPAAVCVHPDGYKMVNYPMLGITRVVH